MALGERMMIYKTRQGFSLIEVMVVVMIAAIVMSVLATVMGSSFEILRTGETRAQLNSNGRTALNYLCDDIETAAYIPLAFDRDLNGYKDELGVDPDTGETLGYDEKAVWRVAWLDPDDFPTVAASFYISEAYGHQITTVHNSSVTVAGRRLRAQSFSVPKSLTFQGQESVADYSSLFRLAIPTSNQMPYYLALEWDRNGDGVMTGADLLNTGSSNSAVDGDGLGEIVGYPSLVPVGSHKETAVLIQDLNAEFSDGTTRRFRQIPISSNITRVKYEYLHEVPVYISRANGSDVEVAYQDLTDGQVYWEDENWVRSGGTENRIPMISHWELRIIDVANNAQYTDPVTGAEYGEMYWRIADQYPEGYDPNKADGTHLFPPTSTGLGYLAGNNLAGGWNCSVFYNRDSDGDDIGDNAPIDRLAYVTTSVSGATTVAGGLAYLRPDMEAIHGTGYYNYSTDPTGIGDLGDADGIPDGDGIPDDPVPGWWLPYLRAVRVSIIATPRNVIEERIAKSGQVGSMGSPVFYRLDSPIPFDDPNRLVPLANQKQDYVGTGKDLILTKTVPVEYVYRTELIWDAKSAAISQGFFSDRRVELNYRNGSSVVRRDLFPPGSRIQALTPTEKLYEKDTSLP